MPQSTAGELALKYCREFRNAPSLMLARMLKQEYPAAFKDVEAARWLVRFYRGKSGVAHRYDGRKYIVPKAVLPEPEPPKFKIWQLPAEIKRWFIFACSHVPYHDSVAVNTALDYAKSERCDGVLLLGDGIDYYHYSSWLRDPTKRNPAIELDNMAQFLDVIQETLKPKQFIWRESNHEFRLQRYMMLHAPELFHLSLIVSTPTLLNLRERGIAWIPTGNPIQYKELVLLHGDEWKGGANVVSPARRALLKAAQCALIAHGHQTSEQPKMTALGVSLFCWSIGCLCDLHPEWMPLNEWNHGAAILHTKGKWRVDNFRILKRRVI